MRERLLESALVVFTHHGLDASLIDQVIRTAGVSRGTFYNYFKTHEELIAGVANAVGSEIIRLVDPLATRHDHPAVRVASGVQLAFHVAMEHPTLAAFVVRGGVLALRTSSLATEVVSRDLQAGIDAGEFRISSLELGLDLVLGPVLSAFYTLLSDDIGPGFVTDLATSILQSLGVPPAKARRYVAQHAGAFDIPEDSLFVRATKRANQIVSAE